MTAYKPKRQTDSAALFYLNQAGPGRPDKGRHELALDETLADARLVEAKDAATVSSARALAFALDLAEARLDPYAIAQVSPRFAEALDRLGLVDDGPRGAGGGDDDQGDLDDLGAASVVDS